ncbi:hypothetical protein LTR16_003535 [Cryomyces antarcticus]|uniref:Rhodanese domain-containing protein n=1 Tax=Cryomyces antarcticus TaxID=329879 RepID=A0ABR0M6U5_9PEZI|nr:hypothetical protein LTR16_003535 [Cryomyces antarcticus]
MAARTSLLQFAFRTAISEARREAPSVLRTSSNQCLRPSTAARSPPRIQWQHAQIRHHSSPSSNSQVYDFEAIKSFASSPSPDRILIDVREPHEFKPGRIPGSINIPIASQPDALFLGEEEFEDRFGFGKPDKSKVSPVRLLQGV